MKANIFIVSAMVLSTTICTAQTSINDTLKLKAVEITPDSIKKSPKTFQANASYLNKKDLQLNDAINFTPIVNQIPGVYMQSGALNTNRIVVRGVGSRTQYSSNRIKTYINNIPISGADGETVFEDLDPNLFESLTVFKSPQVSYGSNLGGTFVFETADRFKNQLSHSQTIGSFGLLSNSTVLSFSKNKSSIAIAYNKVEKEGFRENSDYSKDGFTLIGIQGIGVKSKLNYYLNYTNLKAFIPSSIDQSTFTNEPTSADFNWEQAQGFESYNKLVAGFTIERNYGKNLTSSITLFGQFKDGYEPRPFNILDENYERIGARIKLEWKHQLFSKPSNLEGGFEILDDFSEINTYENRYKDFPNQGSIQGNTINQSLTSITAINYFLNETTNWTSNLKTTVGLNINSTNYRTEKSILTNRTTQKLKPTIAPQVELVYAVNSQLELYSTLSVGTSTPGIDNAINSDGTFNSNINSEKGRNAEVGAKMKVLKNQIVFNLALYQLNINDLIVAKPLSNNEFTIVNAGKANHRGIELNAAAKFKLSKNWVTASNFSSSFNYFKFETYESNGITFREYDLAGSPTHTINLNQKIEYKTYLTFNLNYFQVGKIPLNDENTTYSGSYQMATINATYNLQLHSKFTLALKAGINNIFDKNYAASVLPNAVGFGTNAPRYYYPGDGRNYFGSIKLTYGFK